MNVRPRVFSVVPAAGCSRRMGTHKLLLPWPTTNAKRDLVIDAVLRAWTTSQVDHAVIVVRESDHALQEACRRWPVDVLAAASDPPDMKASVLLGARHLESKYAVTELDYCFVAPADLPGISTAVINALLAEVATRECLITPRFGGKVSHPLLMSWPIIDEIAQLAANQGINVITDRHPQHCLDFPIKSRVPDLDTPEEYRAALEASERVGWKPKAEGNSG